MQLIPPSELGVYLLWVAQSFSAQVQDGEEWGLSTRGAGLPGTSLQTERRPRPSELPGDFPVSPAPFHVPGCELLPPPWANALSGTHSFWGPSFLGVSLTRNPLSSQTAVRAWSTKNACFQPVCKREFFRLPLTAKP